MIRFDPGTPVAIPERMIPFLLSKKTFSIFDGCVHVSEIDSGTPNLKLCVSRTLGGIGDVIMTLPVTLGLKEKYPGCHITYATSYGYFDMSLPTVASWCPFIDRIINSDNGVDYEKFDAAVNVSHCCAKYESEHEPAIRKHRTEIFCEEACVRPTRMQPALTIPEDLLGSSMIFLDRKLPAWRDQPLMVIHNESMSSVRSLPHELCQAVVTQLLATWPHAVILNFSWDLSRPMKGAINMPRSTLPPKAGILACADLLIACDSCFCHLAGALDIPSLNIFGPTDPDCRLKYYPKARTLVSPDYQCHPCWYSPKCVTSGFHTEAKHAGACLSTMSSDLVYSMAANIFEEEGKNERSQRKL